MNKRVQIDYQLSIIGSQHGLDADQKTPSTEVFNQVNDAEW